MTFFLILGRFLVTFLTLLSLFSSSSFSRLLLPDSFSGKDLFREWPRYCQKVHWTNMAQNGPNDHFGQNDLIPNWI